MNKNQISRSDRMAYFLTLAAIAGFLIFNIADYVIQKNYINLIAAVVCGIIAFILVIVLQRLNRFISAAFSIPMSLYIIWVIAAFICNSFSYFFPVCLTICCVGALYFDKRKLLYHIIVSNIISLILFILGIPMTKAGADAGMFISFNEVLIFWFLSLVGSICILLGVAYAADRTSIASKAHHFFTALLTATPNKIVLMDSLNRVTYVSRSFMDLTTVPDPRMAIGRPVFDLFKDQSVKEMFGDIIRKGAVADETWEVFLGGKQYFFEVISSKLVHETKGRIINLVDITPVMRAKFEAEAASQSKSAFLATMSHEIRTPLNAVIGLSEIELQNKIPLETRQNLEKIHTSGANLLGIINDILDISKIEAGSFELIPVDYEVPSMVNDTVQLNAVRIGAKKITFKLEIDDTIPIRLLGDELRVKQVLNNLLSNAFKYTKEGSVRFKIAWEWREGVAWVTFTVQDTGQGMRQEDIPRIFSEYSQLDALANRHIEGTGLGLSITKNLVDLMKGVISVESEYGKGSVFTVRIPQKIVDPKPIGEATAKNLELFRYREIRQSRGFRLTRSYMPYGKVLVVDDVETNLDVATGLMLPYGLSIDIASSGLEAIEKIRAAGVDDSHPRYDLIFIDHMMPGMDGVEAVRIIRKEIGSDYAKTVPIIALTANALAGNEEMFLSSGFNAYISKPIDVVQLDVALNTWIRNKQPRETLFQAEMDKMSQDEKDENNSPGILEGVAIDGIDLLLGRERYVTEKAYLDVLRSYHLHTPALLEKMRTLSRNQGEGISHAEYALTVHGLKGSSYGICADMVGRGAEMLEMAAKDGDLDTVLAGNGAFIESVELLLMDLGELLKKAAAAQGEKSKAPLPDPVLLAKLLEASRHYKASLMEEVLAELESYEYETGGELVTWFREQVDNLEYEAIRTRLESPDPFIYNKGQESQ